jgi:hypothetical protein
MSFNDLLFWQLRNVLQYPLRRNTLKTHTLLVHPLGVRVLTPTDPLTLNLRISWILKILDFCISLGILTDCIDLLT